MPCPPLVPISIIPPVSEGVAPILWRNGNQITRLNIPLNPSFLIYDGTKTRWGDGSAQAPVYLPNIQEVNGPTVTYVAGITSTGQLVKTIGASGTALVGGTAGAVVYQTGPSATGFTAVGTTGQLLSSNGVSAPTWLNQSAIAAGNLASGVAGSLPYQSAPSTTAFTAAGTSGQVLKSNGTSAPSWINSASTNTASAIVQRDAAGNFSAGTITASLTGTASNVADGVVTPSKLSTGGPVWDTSGNVGIGTSSPTAKLDVVTAGATVRAYDPNAGSGTYSRMQVENGTGVIASLQTYNSAAFVNVETNHQLSLRTNNTDRLVFGNAGGIDAQANPITNCPTTAKAWVNFNGTTATPSTIRSSYNVSSITKNGTGNYTVNFTTPMADANYSIAGVTSQPTALTNGYTGVTYPFNTPPTTNSFSVYVTGPVSGVNYDPNIVNIQVFGN